MGNRGVPSKNCEPCRLKRRKCDLKQPGCSQCTRAGISCPGYRDPFSLRLRNETVSTAVKVQERKRRLLHPEKGNAQLSPEDAALVPFNNMTPPRTTNSSPTGSLVPYSRSPSAESEGSDLCWLCFDHKNGSCCCGETSPAEKLPWLPKSLDIGLADAALNNFMHTYAGNSMFEYLPNFYSTLHNADQTIDFAITVPALVLLSQDLQNSAPLKLAYSRYAMVLQSTQNALNDPELAVRDSTLVSVLLLALFEALVQEGREFPKNWNAHVQGSAALLKMRGAEQFQTSLGWHLFFHASHTVRTKCLLQAIPVPKSLDVSHREDVPAILPSNASKVWNHWAIRVGEILDIFADLRTAEAARLKPSVWIRKAWGLDNDLESLLAEVARHAPFTPVPPTDKLYPSEAFCAYAAGADRYNSQKEVRRWNTLRMLRVFLDDYICEVLEKSDWNKYTPATDPDYLSEELRSWLYQTVSYRCEQAMTAILRSVPYLINVSDKPQFVVKSLICPLAAVAVSRLAPGSAREYARNRLRYIGETYGLPQAIESADMAMESNDVGDWLFLSHFS